MERQTNGTQITVDSVQVGQHADVVAIGENPNISLNEMTIGGSMNLIAIDRDTGPGLITASEELIQRFNSENRPHCSNLISQQPIINALAIGAPISITINNQQEIYVTGALSQLLRSLKLHAIYGDIKLPLQNRRLTIKPPFIQLTLINDRAKLQDKYSVHDAKQTADEKSWHESRLNSFEDIHNVERARIKLEDIFCKSDGKINSNIITYFKRVLVYGRAGIGKSTLLRYLAYTSELPNDMFALNETQSSPVKPDWIRQFEIVFYIPLRLLNVFRTDPLSTASPTAQFIYFCLCQENPHEMNKEIALSSNVIDALLNGHGFSEESISAFRVCLLLDGLDEARRWLTYTNMANGEDDIRVKVLQRLLHLSAISHVSTVLSTRPMTIGPEIYCQDDDCQVIETMGFDDEAIREYVHQYFTSTPEEKTANDWGIKERELQTFLKQQPMMWGVAHVPVALGLLCRYWDTHFDKVRRISQHAHVREISFTLTEIYQTLLYDLHDYCGTKSGLNIIDSISTWGSLSKDEMQEHPLMCFLEHLALSGMIEGSILLETPLIEQAFQLLRVTKKEDQLLILEGLRDSGFLCFGELPYDGAFPLTIHFFHLSLQEFLAANKIKRAALAEAESRTLSYYQGNMQVTTLLEDFIGEYKYKPSFEMVWCFVAGLLVQEKENTTKNKHKKQMEALALFWKVMQAEPRDLLIYGDVALWLRCLEEGLNQNYVPHQSLMLNMIEIVFTQTQLNRTSYSLSIRFEAIFRTCPIITRRLLEQSINRAKTLPDNQSILLAIKTLNICSSRIIRWLYDGLKTWNGKIKQDSCLLLIQFKEKTPNFPNIKKMLLDCLKTEQDIALRKHRRMGRISELVHALLKVIPESEQFCIRDILIERVLVEENDYTVYGLMDGIITFLEAVPDISNRNLIQVALLTRFYRENNKSILQILVKDLSTVFYESDLEEAHLHIRRVLLERKTNPDIHNMLEQSLNNLSGNSNCESDTASSQHPLRNPCSEGMLDTYVSTYVTPSLKNLQRKRALKIIYKLLWLRPCDWGNEDTAIVLTDIIHNQEPVFDNQAHDISSLLNKLYSMQDFYEYLQSFEESPTWIKNFPQSEKISLTLSLYEHGMSLSKGFKKRIMLKHVFFNALKACSLSLESICEYINKYQEWNERKLLLREYIRLLFGNQKTAVWGMGTNLFWFSNNEKMGIDLDNILCPEQILPLSNDIKLLQLAAHIDQLIPQQLDRADPTWPGRLHLFTNEAHAAQCAYFYNNEDIGSLVMYFELWQKTCPDAESWLILNGISYHNLACCFHAVDKIPEARSFFIKGIEAMKKLKPSILAEYAHLLYRYGEYSEALAQLEAGLNLEIQSKLSYSGWEKEGCEPQIRKLVEKAHPVALELDAKELIYYLQILCHRKLQRADSDEMCQQSLRLLETQYASSVLIDLATKAIEPLDDSNCLDAMPPTPKPICHQQLFSANRDINNFLLQKIDQLSICYSMVLNDFVKDANASYTIKPKDHWQKEIHSLAYMLNQLTDASLLWEETTFLAQLETIVDSAKVSDPHIMQYCALKTKTKTERFVEQLISEANTLDKKLNPEKYSKKCRIM